jgi:hypothetical protein
VTNRARVRAVVWAIALGRAFAAAPASAEDQPRAVDVTVVGTAADLDRVRDLVPRLAGGGVRWLRVDKLDPADVLRERRDGDASAVRAWVDVTVATRARLTFATRSGERVGERGVPPREPVAGGVGPSQGPTYDRFLVRDVDLSGRFDEVDRAALTEVLESSIGALLADERAGLTRAEAEAVLARREPPAPNPQPPSLVASPPSQQQMRLDRRPSRWALGFFYAAQTVADGGTVDHGPGLTLSMAPWQRFSTAHASGRGPVVFAGAQYRLLLHERAQPIGVALYTVATRAGVECGPLWWSRLRVRLGAGADFTHVAPESSDPTATLTPMRWATTFVASAALRANLAGQRDRFWLSGLLFADVAPTEVRYAAAVGGTTTPVFSPWRIRPGLTLEATFF